MSDTAGDGLDALALAAAVHWRQSRRCGQDPSGSLIFLPSQTSTPGPPGRTPPSHAAVGQGAVAVACLPRRMSKRPAAVPMLAPATTGQGHRSISPTTCPPPPDLAVPTRPKCVRLYEKLRDGAGVHVEEEAERRRADQVGVCRRGWRTRQRRGQQRAARCEGGGGARAAEARWCEEGGEVNCGRRGEGEEVE